MREKNVGPDVDISENQVIAINQTQFLSNIRNKVNFVNLLSQYLQSNGVNTKISNEDADTVIIRSAIEFKDNSVESLVTVVGNDIDLLILLITKCSDGPEIYFYNRPSNKSNELYSSKDYKRLQKSILFAHAFAGCDSTSAIYGKSKKEIITLVKSNADLQKAISIFYKPLQNANDIYAVAEKVIMKLYCTNNENASLHEVRYKIFCTSIADKKKKLSLSPLPPTDAALKEHVKRVYYQMQMWLGFPLDPLLWGWKKARNMLLPISNTKPVSPKELS